jgi:hypothetical protein
MPSAAAAFGNDSSGSARCGRRRRAFFEYVNCHAKTGLLAAVETIGG